MSERVEPPPAEASSRVVLIADNDRSVSSVLGDVLRRRGLTVETVADGAAAEARLERGGIALLVCDLDMPVLSGEELLARLCRRTVAPLPPPTVVISGFVDDPIEARLSRLDIVRRVLRKPFDVMKFADEVAALLAAPPAGASPDRAGPRRGDGGSASLFED